MRSIVAFALLALTLCGCLRPGEERPDLDLDVGVASIEGLSVQVVDGQATIRELGPNEMILWAQAPVLELHISPGAPTKLHLTVLNCMPGAELRVGQDWTPSLQTDHPTQCVFDVRLEEAKVTEVLIAPRDYDTAESYRFAVMGDVQTALNTVDEVFQSISAMPDLRFVLCTGDIVQDGEYWEYELYEEQLAYLRIPIFSTVGNHEVRKPPQRWHQLFGRFSAHFRFKDVDFSLVDSGNASIDPKTYNRLKEWLDEGRDRVHIFGTHFPPRDPIGGRNASFRSRNEGAKLLARLAEGRVDLTLYGHIHSYYSYENAGIPAYVSGGGGALPERYEGIGRHFLAISVSPAGLGEVEFVDVDSP